MQVYPNPVKEQLFIQNNLLNDGNYILRITDMMGKEIIRKDVYFGFNQTVNLNISSLIPQGIYLLQLMDRNSKTVFNHTIQISH